MLLSSFKWTFCLIVMCIVTCTASPPPDPIQCSSPNNTNCTITNAYGVFSDRTTCHVAQVTYPSNEQELVSIVGIATKEKRKMKVATRTSHALPNLVCPGSRDGLLISTKNLNRVLEVDKSAMTMTVESGMVLKDLIDEAAKVGLALPYTPYWWGLTVGGILATGAHGSSLWGKGSAVSDYVIRLRIVTPAGPDDGYAVVRTLLDEGALGGEFNAAKLSLGVLGVISQVTFQMQPIFKRSITYITKDDKDLEDQMASHGRQHEFADITWLPSQHKVAYRYDGRVSINVSGNGLIDLPVGDICPVSTTAMERSTDESLEAKRDTNKICQIARDSSSELETGDHHGLTNDGISFKGYPVIGYQNRLQASGSCFISPEDGLATSCRWDKRIIKRRFIHQPGISIPLSKVKNFIRDIKKLVELVPKGLCVIDIHDGFLMRYVTHSNAYLGKQEDSIFFDTSYYRSMDPSIPRLYEDILEEIEQMAVFKYEGLPHWGKNRNVAFHGVINKYKNAGNFLKVKAKYDPLGLFSNKWTDQVFGLKKEVSEAKDGCALDGLCICSLDVHCAPSKGYFCRPGKVFKNARVCTLLSSKETIVTGLSPLISMFI